MTNTKFVVKVKRGSGQTTQYVRRLDRSPIAMTTDRKLALLMGRLTAEDAVNAIQSSRCIAELVSVQVGPKARKVTTPESSSIPSTL